MRRLTRGELPQRAAAALLRYQQEINDKLRRKKRKTAFVDARWKAHRQTIAVRCAEQMLRAMASGVERCMYCEDSQGCDIDHVRPRATCPHQTFDWPNMLWVCAACNRAKAASTLAIINPVDVDPLDHVTLSLLTGKYAVVEGSDIGASTIDSALGRRLCSGEMCRGRAYAYQNLTILLGQWAYAREARDDQRAQTIRSVIVAAPFSAVFAALLRAAAQPMARDVLGDTLCEILADHTELQAWLDEADQQRHRAASERCEPLAAKIRR